MFYSQNFAPNESYSSLRTIPGLAKHILFAQNQPNIEKEITSSFFPKAKSEPKGVMYFSGRSALYHLLSALKVEKGSEVILQSFTCVAVTIPIIHAGLKPVYVDINPKDFSADYDDLLSKITNKAKVLILQHTFGILPESRQKIIDICREKNLFLIEDCAHGVNLREFTYPQEEELNNHAILLSFGRSKLISSVFGSCIVTTHQELHNTLKTESCKLPSPTKTLVLQCILYKYLTPLIKSSFSISSHLGKFFHLITKNLNFFPDEIVSMEKSGGFYDGFDCTFPSSLAYILSHELKSLSSKIKYAENSSQNYAAKLNIPNPKALLRFPYICSDLAQKKRILTNLKGKGIDIGTWYEAPIAPPLHKEILSKSLYIKGSCRVCESTVAKIINLPLHAPKNVINSVIKELLIK